MKRTLLLAALAASACAQSAQPWSPEVEVAAITERCGLPRSTARVVAAGEIHIQPSADTRYEQVDCVLREIRASTRLSTFTMGFVGNEAPANAIESDAGAR